MAAALAPAVWLGSEACLKNRELAAAHEQLRVLTAEEQRLDTALAFLRGPETRRAGTREDRNKPRGLYFVKRTGTAERPGTPPACSVLTPAVAVTAEPEGVPPHPPRRSW